MIESSPAKEQHSLFEIGDATFKQLYAQSKLVLS